MLAAVTPPPPVTIPLEGAPSWELERYDDMRAEVIRRAQRLLKIRGLKRADPKFYAAFVAAERRLCKGADEFDWKALVYWINEYGWVRAEKCPDPRLKNAPFVLWPSQEEACRRLCEALKRHPDTGAFLVPKSREIGMTWLLLLFAQWLWQFHGSSCLLGSRKEDLVDTTGDMGSLFERLRYQLGRQPRYLMPPYRQNFCIVARLDCPATITGEATVDDFGRGKRYRLILVDEYAAVPAPIAKALLRGTESAGPLFLLYNPAGEDHPSFKLYQELPREDVLELPWSADPYRPYDPELAIDSEHQPFLLHVFRTGKLSWHDIRREYCVSHAPPAEGLIYDYDPAIEYDEDTPEWAAVASAARGTWMHLGGWDFGSGTSLTACPFALIHFEEGPDAFFTLWIDEVRVWERAAWYDVAAEALEVMAAYKGMRWHLGDPAGAQKQADQESWESHLSGAGIPIMCLDASFNNFEAQEWSIRNCQSMINTHRLRIHRRNGAPLIKALKSWRRRLAPGVELSHANGRVAPMKDWPSHVCQALLYLLAGAALQQRSVQRQRNAAAAPLPVTSGAGAQEATAKFLEAFTAGRPMG